MKRTNIELNEDLVKDGLELSGLKTKKDLLNKALENFVRHLRQKKILGLAGKIQWDGDLELMRSMRV